MPSVKQSSQIDMSRVQPLDDAAPTTPPTPPSPGEVYAASPFMTCSLPPAAASLDQYLRQFYSKSGIPQMRILRPSL